jgi:4-hydroxybenzoate polyprenyltransferase
MRNEANETPSAPGSAEADRGSSFAKLLLPQTLGLNAFLALGFIAAATDWNVSWFTIVLILLAFIGARNAGHAFNQIVDRRFDALNPRTADRPLVTGSMSLRTAAMVVVLNVALLFAAAWFLNWLVFLLAPIALALVLGYSYAKRVTAWTTVLLGLVQAMIPAGVYLATKEALPLPALVAGFAVIFFGTAFESVHSLGDMESDRRLGLRSIPLLLGARRAVLATGLILVASLVLFGLFGYLVPLKASFFVLLAAMGAVAAWEVWFLWGQAQSTPGTSPAAKGLENIGFPLMANLAMGGLFFAGVMVGLYLPV